MTKNEFIDTLNNQHSVNLKDICISTLHSITRLSMDMCSKLVNSLWNCSENGYFGNNIYQLLEVSSNSDPNIELNPNLKTNGCTVYIIYPDEHAAIFALYKIKEF